MDGPRRERRRRKKNRRTGTNVKGDVENPDRHDQRDARYGNASPNRITAPGCRSSPGGDCDESSTRRGYLERRPRRTTSASAEGIDTSTTPPQPPICHLFWTHTPTPATQSNSPHEAGSLSCGTPTGGAGRQHHERHAGPTGLLRGARTTGIHGAAATTSTTLEDGGGGDDTNPGRRPAAKTSVCKRRAPGGIVSPRAVKQSRESAHEESVVGSSCDLCSERRRVTVQ